MLSTDRLITPLPTLFQVCNEYRSETVHQTFLTAFAEAGFGPLKREKEGSMHPDFRHELIHVFKMKRKPLS